MRTVIILGPSYPHRGGLSTFNERLAREFQQQGFKVSLFGFSLQYPSILFPGKSQFSDEIAPEGLDIHPRVNSINPLNWIAVGRELKRLSPDIIVVRFWLPFMGASLGTILRIAKSNRHTRVVAITDNVIPHEKRPGDLFLTRYFLRSCDAFLTMSENVLIDLKKFVSGKPVATVLHPVYDNFGSPVTRQVARKKFGLDDRDPVLLFFGFIRKYKGLDILLDALAILVKKPGPLQNTRLIIAGEFYEEEDIYQQQIDALGIREHILLHNSFIAADDVKYYFSAADVLVQPYRNASQSGVTPLAYHFELPMVVTNVGGLPAYVPHEKAGLVAEPNAASLASAIERYFELGEQHFIPHLRKEKHRYSWENLVKAIVG